MQQEDKKIEVRVRRTDLYDYTLEEIKWLVSARNKSPEEYRKKYDGPISKAIMKVGYLAKKIFMPEEQVVADLEIALQGGKYRDLYSGLKTYPEFDSKFSKEDLERKKKFLKPKSKRKQNKNCRCK